MANNYVGTGSGMANPFIQAARLNSTAPVASYDPDQTLDATQLAQQMFQQNSALRTQQFNQENPRMALPQNFGAALGNVLSNAISPQQQAQSVPQGQPDPTQAIKQRLNELTQQNLQQMQASGETADYGKAQYMAASAIAADPDLGKLPATQAIAARAVSDAKERLGYTPQGAAQADALNAQRKMTTQEGAIKLQEARDSLQYTAVDMAPGKDGIPIMKQYGTNLSAFTGDQLDPDLENKKNALVAAAKSAGAQNPTLMLTKDYENSKLLLAQQAANNATARIQAQAQVRQDALANVDQDRAKQIGHLLYTGEDPSIINGMLGTGVSATPMKQAALQAAIDEGNAIGKPYTPTDAHVAAMNQRAFESGAPYTQFSRMETVPAHLQELNQAIDALGNGSFKPGNALYQKALQLNGGQVAAPFQLAKTLAMTEMAASLSPRGGADAEIDRLTKGFEAADNPASLHAAVTETERFWQDKASDMGQQYNTALHGRKNFVPDQLTDPAAQELLTRRYPVNVPAGKAGQLMFNRLPDDVWITHGSNPPAQVKQYKAMLGQSSG